jgi:hypothetical protein
MLILCGCQAEFCDPQGLLYFADYAPKAFRKLRQSIGIDEEEYYKALCCSTEYRQKLTEGKSYCSFYFVDVTQPLRSPTLSSRIVTVTLMSR